MSLIDFLTRLKVRSISDHLLIFSTTVYRPTWETLQTHFTHSSKLMVQDLKTCRFFIASLSSNIYCKWFGHPFFDWKFPPFRTVVGGLSWRLFGQSGLLSWVFVPRNGKGSVAKAAWFPPFLELRPWPTTVWCTKHRGRMDVHQETKIEHYWNVLNILHGIDVWSSLCISQSSTAPRIAFQWRC